VNEGDQLVVHPSLSVDCVVSAPFAENSYILHLPDRLDCLLVDPGLEPEKIVRVVEKKELTPVAILNTHGHSDHIAGNGYCKRRWPTIPLLIGAGDAPKLSDAFLNLSAPFGLQITSPPADRELHEGDVVNLAGIALEVIETPGHSTGHIVFLWKGAEPWVLIAGDVLFQGSIGRTDFPDGDTRQLVTAIHQRLFTLPDETLVLPGHGPLTTIGEEIRDNPFVGRPAGYRGR
jgi:glyoxylase-like metal-dependent hydrolase (beta-lactamase superfamily II)